MIVLNVLLYYTGCKPIDIDLTGYKTYGKL